MAKHLSRAHGIDVCIQDLWLGHKLDPMQEHPNMKKAKKSLHEFSPKVAKNAKLSKIFLAGYMECAKGVRANTSIIEVDLVTPSPRQKFGGRSDAEVCRDDVTIDSNVKTHDIGVDVEFSYGSSSNTHVIVEPIEQGVPSSIIARQCQRRDGPLINAPVRRSTRLNRNAG
ncbi:hypothetical protein L7F22_010951 [Adiantum nelumboides]|nr:hypothetical protein [Adiantum nelumboides]